MKNKLNVYLQISVSCAKKQNISRRYICLKGKSANLILHYIEQFGSRLKICKKPFLKIFCRSRDTKCHTSSRVADVIVHEPINRRAHTGRDVYWFMCDDVRGSGRCVTLSISASTQYFQKQFFTYF